MSGKIKVTFIINDGEEKTVEAPIGLSILEIAHSNDLDLEGACEGSLACATCQRYFRRRILQQIKKTYGSRGRYA